MGDRTPALLDRALQAVGPGDTPIRAELLARLSAELYFSAEPERSREHPPLARHLERSIDTGLWCVYRPEQPVRWRM